MTHPLTEAEAARLTRKIGTWGLWRAIVALPLNVFNIVVTATACGFLLIYVFLPHQQTHTLAEVLRGWAGVGVTYGTTILGFLLAGFTIFATISKPSLFLKMAGVRYEQTEFTYLEYNFYSFMNVFVVYLILVGASIFIVLFCGAGELVPIIIDRYVGTGSASELTRTGIVIIGTVMVWSLVMLKSFVMNVYHVVMTSIRWDWVLQEEERERNV
ncbi:MAG: hypothetical protein M3Y56_04980, partial [Armatimonadota bacterium]|nr:hypothetical protein [Armatimonadota bacterium]